MSGERITLFEEVCSTDFLKFSFGGRGYQDQLYDSIAKTKKLAGVKVEEVIINNTKIVWVSHDFGFLGGSLGCAEGEKITRAFEHATKNSLPICVQCKTGGARMQEGTSSLMQMAKVSVAVEAQRRASLPFVSVLNDPTYGGVSASYAMQADVRIAMPGARIGFAGPQVILNTMCGADQDVFDTQCPPDFQSASYVLEHGQLDMVLPASPEGVVETPSQIQSRLEDMVSNIVSLLSTSTSTRSQQDGPSTKDPLAIPSDDDKNQPFDYTKSRKITRPQTQDVIQQVFTSFVELRGDGRVGVDPCIRGGLASFQGRSCVVLGTYKGHTPTTMQAANHGMSSPHGYRTALRLMQLAERFGLPVVTLVDTVGAWPTFECERDGQSEAIATNLTAMASLKVPIVTILLGEGGSGGALGIGMGNRIGMLSGGYFGVISPEGAASILGRYKSDAHKATQFPLDCQELAKAQCIYAHQLLSIGVVDEIIWEAAGQEETFQSFPVLRARIHQFIADSLEQLSGLNTDAIVEQRYGKFRALGTFALLDESGRDEQIKLAESKKGPSKAGATSKAPVGILIRHLAEEIVTGGFSRYRGLAPAVSFVPPAVPSAVSTAPVRPADWTNAKRVLDQGGPEALAAWVKSQSRVLVTDTTLRDAHQSLLATRVRTEDLVKGAMIANGLLADAFSLEAWGGATFDVAMRFLDECPWDRLRELRKACPDICLQMLIRGANAVGYTSYPDNVVVEFIRLAALNGMDVFRIFDCFNVVDNMLVAINAVRATGKVAEVCICYTGDLLTSSIYDVAYYRSIAKEIHNAGAHFIGIKDMSGLLKPLEAGPLLSAIREVSDLPVHFHTHATSSGAIATCLEMARLGCEVVDLCTASMADGTSQPSLNAFLAMMEGAPRDPKISFLSLEPYDIYWSKVRDMYSPFESGMKSGSARVYEHKIPGGQYSNLLVQCTSMGLWPRWEEVMDAYRDVNNVLGDIIKVTPSSKCVGDLALYLVTRNVSASDLLDPAKAAAIDFPESVVGLLRGDLGFPHRGFPEAVESVILKGSPKRTVRAGLTLPPVDFAAHAAHLNTVWGSVCAIDAELAMSELMYPDVFRGYMSRRQAKGSLLRHLPTPVYLYAMKTGDEFTMTIPSSLLHEVTGTTTTTTTSTSTTPAAAADVGTAAVRLVSVGPLKEGKRTVKFIVNGSEQSYAVKDSTGKFVFEGPMANSKNSNELGSPMPGVVEKLLVGQGKAVQAGDTLCTVSAMKMEVKVTAPFAATVGSVAVTPGSRVVEGALLLTLVPVP